MKLYLSSYMIPTPQELADLIGKPLESVKTAMITNAKDYFAPHPRQVKMKEAKEKFAVHCLSFDEIDLRELDGADQVKKALADYEFLWVIGGNTFCLRYEMRRSGFDQVIKELLEAGLIWGGDSAGAIIACPTLEGVEYGDNPEFAEEIIYDGLNLIDEYIMPHADSPNYINVLPIIREMNKDNPNYIELKDSEALIIDGDSKKVVSGDGNLSAD